MLMLTNHDNARAYDHAHHSCSSLMLVMLVLQGTCTRATAGAAGAASLRGTATPMPMGPRTTTMVKDEEDKRLKN